MVIRKPADIVGEPKRGRPPKLNPVTDAAKSATRRGKLEAVYLEAQAGVEQAEADLRGLSCDVCDMVRIAIGVAEKISKTVETAENPALRRLTERNLSGLRAIMDDLAGLAPAVEQLVQASGAVLATNGRLAGVAVTKAATRKEVD